MAEKMVDKVLRIMQKPGHIRNIAICAHIDHGKTTLSDNLLSGAGMMSEELAGKQLVLDFHEDERSRGITIDSASVSMIHTLGGEEYLINLIDTPGHIDFSGDVTRAMRAVDGGVVLTCAVEGMMPQTETVLRQALRERVKPILFINKVDRLIRELQLKPEQMQERFVKIINNVNRMIRQIAPPEYKEEWQVKVQDGSVCFGSAFHNWALSLPYMQKHNISFRSVANAYEKDEVKSLHKAAPLHVALLNSVIRHFPNPAEAQKYRVPKLWHGDLEGTMGKSLLSCNPKGPVVFVITKVVVDPQAGEISTGRLFSGTMSKGLNVYMSMAKQSVRVQQVFVTNGAKREIVDNVPAGNIIGVAGLKGMPGETITPEPSEPFEKIQHIFEPVMTKAIQAVRPGDLPKLIEAMKKVSKEDPTITVEINEETGEHLMSGMGELHLEVIENRIKTEKGVDVKTSQPIVVYRETVTQEGQEVEGKTPNKHNKFSFRVEPLEDSIHQAIVAGEIPEMRVGKKDENLWKALEAAGMDSKTSRKVKSIFHGNLLIDQTRGQVHLGEVIELIHDMFENVMKAGPIAKEPCFKVRVSLTDMKLHEDAIHRGPAQVYPAVRDGIRGSMHTARPLIFEPVQTLRFEAPEEFMGEISKLISNKRGQLLDMQQEQGHVIVLGKLPVAEMFGLASELRSATAGRGQYSLVDQTYQKLPEELQSKIISQIRQRKGLKEEEGNAS